MNYYKAERHRNNRKQSRNKAGTGSKKLMPMKLNAHHAKRNRNRSGKSNYKSGKRIFIKADNSCQMQNAAKNQDKNRSKKIPHNGNKPGIFVFYRGRKISLANGHSN